MQVYCWKGLRFAARQDLDGFSRFTEYGIEGVVPMELLPSDVRSKYQAKPSDRSKRAKKEETKGAAQQAEENQVFLTVLSFPISQHLQVRLMGGTRVDLEASAAPMDTDVTATTPTAEENQKQSSDTDAGQEAGQSEADAEAEAGMIDGETDAEVDLDAVG
ncbi:THO complex subunit 1 [Vitis vinifera]|uniref:THO complex subunit 1 n=1 Tax=Vitis vinifera TaxID=29760 RepID=A0A438I8C8_VITVI|nr:THO complex subunit 1 [Vitis vinifera]